MKTICIQPDFKKGNGLVPVVVQQYNPSRRGKVLMLAYADEQAYSLTLETGFAHFWSRSRNKIWKKGEASGNTLVVKKVFVDCDQDTLLYLVIPKGSVCHFGRQDCFFDVIRWVNASLCCMREGRKIKTKKRQLTLSISDNCG